jgi:hypothetical protein
MPVPVPSNLDRRGGTKGKAGSHYAAALRLLIKTSLGRPNASRNIGTPYATRRNGRGPRPDLVAAEFHPFLPTTGTMSRRLRADATRIERLPAFSPANTRRQPMRDKTFKLAPRQLKAHRRYPCIFNTAPDDLRLVRKRLWERLGQPFCSAPFESDWVRLLSLFWRWSWIGGHRAALYSIVPSEGGTRIMRGPRSLLHSPGQRVIFQPAVL